MKKMLILLLGVLCFSSTAFAWYEPTDDIGFHESDNAYMDSVPSQKTKSVLLTSAEDRNFSIDGCLQSYTPSMDENYTAVLKHAGLTASQISDETAAYVKNMILAVKCGSANSAKVEIAYN